MTRRDRIQRAAERLARALNSRKDLTRDQRWSLSMQLSRLQQSLGMRGVTAMHEQAERLEESPEDLP